MKKNDYLTRISLHWSMIQVQENEIYSWQTTELSASEFTQ